jgi:Spy/CpxP family protein refolding chaperone
MERAFGEAGGQFWNNPNTVKQLNLTDDQRKSMDGILQEHKMTLVDLQASLKKAELGMEPLMKADQPNQGAILAQIDKVAQARAELEKANARFLLGLRGKLTPDQWKQLQTMRQNRMEHGAMRENERGAWGQGGARPGMGAPGGRFRGGQQQGPPPAGAPEAAPPPPPAGGPSGAGTGEVQ